MGFPPRTDHAARAPNLQGEVRIPKIPKSETVDSKAHSRFVLRIFVFRVSLPPCASARRPLAAVVGPATALVFEQGWRRPFFLRSARSAAAYPGSTLPSLT